ncbi:hypothetical protein [Cupriavidus necator]
MPGTEPTLNCPRYGAGQRPKLAGKRLIDPEIRYDCASRQELLRIV